MKYFWRWLGNSVLVVGRDHGGGAGGRPPWAASRSGASASGSARYISGMTLFTYIIPASFLSIPFFKIMGDYDLLDTYWALIFAMTTFASPYALWVLWDYAKTIPPEIDESAAIDGAGPVRRSSSGSTCRSSLPTLIAIGTYAFFFAWNEYLYAVLFLQGEKMITLPVGHGELPDQRRRAVEPPDGALGDLLDPARDLLLRLPPLPHPRPRLGRGAGDLS